MAQSIFDATNLCILLMRTCHNCLVHLALFLLLIGRLIWRYSYLGMRNYKLRYNRPWYEFAQKYDVAHGLFRTNLSNFLMHRVFDQKPQLSQNFLIVDPEQVTDVFAVTETTDKIYGQIWFDITCKLPIARVAIPRLD